MACADRGGPDGSGEVAGAQGRTGGKDKRTGVCESDDGSGGISVGEYG